MGNFDLRQLRNAASLTVGPECKKYVVSDWVVIIRSAHRYPES